MNHQVLLAYVPNGKKGHPWARNSFLRRGPKTGLLPQQGVQASDALTARSRLHSSNLIIRVLQIARKMLASTSNTAV